MSRVGQLTDSTNFQSTCPSREPQLREIQCPNTFSRTSSDEMNNVITGVSVVCVCLRYERLQLCSQQPQAPPSPPSPGPSGHPPIPPSMTYRL